jgi:hypothetical protein
MALSFAAPVAHEMLKVILAKIDGGTGAGVIRIYAGPVPTSADANLAESNTRLAELTCSDPSADQPAMNTLTLKAINEDASANADGTATFFRIADSSLLTVVLQGDCTETGKGGALELNTVKITANSPVAITSATFGLA